MTNAAYQEQLTNCTEKLSLLAPSELHYYLLLLINSIKSNSSKLTMNLLEELSSFIDNLVALKPDSNDIPQRLNDLMLNLERMSEISKISSLPVRVGYSLLNVIGAFASFLAGALGGLIGAFAGVGRGIINLRNPFSEGLIGFVTGYFFGAAIAYRLPKKLGKDELTRQIKFCLNGLEACVGRIQLQGEREFNLLKDKTKDSILMEVFNGDTDAFKQFLNEEVPYQIGTYKAQFLSPTLEGYVGHHAIIKVSVPLLNSTDPNNKIFQIELSPTDSDLSKPFEQSEERVTSGDGIINMLALHELLQQTHYCSLQYTLTRLKPGDSDCLSYVNKILIGTKQNATSLKRFIGEDTWIGRNIVGFFVQKLSPFREDILNVNAHPESTTSA